MTSSSFRDVVGDEEVSKSDVVVNCGKLRIWRCQLEKIKEVDQTLVCVTVGSKGHCFEVGGRASFTDSSGGLAGGQNPSAHMVPLVSWSKKVVLPPSPSDFADEVV